MRRAVRRSAFGVLGSGFGVVACQFWLLSCRFWVLGCRFWVLGLRFQVLDGEEIRFDDRQVFDGACSEVGGEVAVDFVGDERSDACGERAGEGAGAGPNFYERLVWLWSDRADYFVDPRRLEKMLAEALARADHSASPRQ